MKIKIRTRELSIPIFCDSPDVNKVCNFLTKRLGINEIDLSLEYSVYLQTEEIS